MNVFKFGGASVKDASSVKNMCNIIKQYKDDKPLLVVISAMDKTTNALEVILEKAYKQDLELEKSILALKDFHIKICLGLFSEDHSVFSQIDKFFVQLANTIKKIDLDYNLVYDQVVCFGELISTTIIAEYLNTIGFKAKWIDARKYIQTDERWREGKVDWDWTESQISSELPQFLETHVLITQGFIGGTITGKTTTLGREGSDYSAAIFAFCLNAEAVTIWKDVPGILNADPKRIKNTTLYKKLPYKEAAEMTYYGATVIHPKTIKPLANKKIQLKVKSFLNPENEGTVIGDFPKEDLAPAIIFKPNQALVSFHVRDLSSISQRKLNEILRTLSVHNIKINMMQNSATSMITCVNYDDAALQKVKKRFSKMLNIFIQPGLQIITIKNYTEELVNEYSEKENLLIQKSSSTFQVVTY